MVTLTLEVRNKLVVCVHSSKVIAEQKMSEVGCFNLRASIEQQYTEDEAKVFKTQIAQSLELRTYAYLSSSRTARRKRKTVFFHVSLRGEPGRRFDHLGRKRKRSLWTLLVRLPFSVSSRNFSQCRSLCVP